MVIGVGQGASAASSRPWRGRGHFGAGCGVHFTAIDVPDSSKEKSCAAARMLRVARSAMRLASRRIMGATAYPDGTPDTHDAPARAPESSSAAPARERRAHPGSCTRFATTARRRSRAATLAATLAAALPGPKPIATTRLVPRPHCSIGPACAVSHRAPHAGADSNGLTADGKGLDVGSKGFGTDRRPVARTELEWIVVTSAADRSELRPDRGELRPDRGEFTTERGSFPGDRNRS